VPIAQFVIDPALEPPQQSFERRVPLGNRRFGRAEIGKQAPIDMGIDRAGEGEGQRGNPVGIALDDVGIVPDAPDARLDGGDGARLEDVEPVIVDGPFDILRAVHRCRDSAGSIGDRFDIAGGERVLSFAWRRFDDVARTAVDEIGPAIDGAGHQALAQTVGGRNHHMVGPRGDRIGGEHHAGTARGNHALDDDRWRRPCPAAALRAIGCNGSLGARAIDARRRRFDIGAGDIEEGEELAGKGIVAPVFVDRRGAHSKGVSFKRRYRGAMDLDPVRGDAAALGEIGTGDDVEIGNRPAHVAQTEKIGGLAADNGVRSIHGSMAPAMASP
jgi:hypothetical protein